MRTKRGLNVTSGDRVEIYERLATEAGVGRPFRLVAQADPRPAKGCPANVEVLEDGSLRFRGAGPPLHTTQQQPAPGSLLELLEQWGGGWMWSGLNLDGDTTWLAQLLLQGH